jgi:uncharacterized protein (DUF488 family)
MTTMPHRPHERGAKMLDGENDQRASIFTIGHSTRALDEFIALLREHGIRRLVDVRRYPGSRRHPHFAREALAQSLAREHIAYWHTPALGGRRTPAANSRNAAWRSASFRGYADHMATPEFRSAMEQLMDWAPGCDTTLMCAEAVPWRCHRQLIADALVVRGVEVLHILSGATPRPHTLHAEARVGTDGSVTYPGDAADSTVRACTSRQSRRNAPARRRCPDAAR